MTAMEKRIERAIQVVRERAEEVADRFWTVHWEQRAKGKRGYLGVRVTARTYTVSIEWYRVRFVQGRDGRKLRQFQSLARGRGWRYPMSAFVWCRSWERALVRELEPEFGALRELGARLVKLAQDYRRLSRALSGIESELGLGPEQDGLTDEEKAVAVRRWVGENRVERGDGGRLAD